MRADAEITAEYDGVVIAVDVEVGQVVAPGQPVITIARPDVREAVSARICSGEHYTELAEFRRDEAVEESSLKYAYHWYKTVVELFTPPESRWVRLSRERMAEAKTLWTRELDEQKEQSHNEPSDTAAAQEGSAVVATPTK